MLFCSTFEVLIVCFVPVFSASSHHLGLQSILPSRSFPDNPICSSPNFPLVTYPPRLHLLTSYFHSPPVKSKICRLHSPGGLVPYSIPHV